MRPIDLKRRWVNQVSRQRYAQRDGVSKKLRATIGRECGLGMSASTKVYHVDYAVLGCGVAGLRAAIEASPGGSVLVLAKACLSESATVYAQNRPSAELSDEDELAVHEQDTLQAGDGLCNPEIVGLLINEAPKYLEQLMEWSAQAGDANRLAFPHETAHSKARILHAHGEPIAREIGRALLARAHGIAHLHIRPRSFATRLIVEKRHAAGLLFVDEHDGSVHEVRAGAILLATGGLGQLYRDTTNAESATGDGMAMAYEAGALLCDLEFVQFYPTALAIQGAPRVPLSEALRREGALLRNISLERFMKRYHEAQEMAPRDVIARAIASEMQRTNSKHVYLDMTSKTKEFFEKRFPRIYATCASCGVDLATDLAPVSPAAHFLMGGVQVDGCGRTSIPGLYAAGETAATGLHGANRFPSNSLLEALVFGARAGAAMRQDLPGSKHPAAHLPGWAPANTGKHDDKPVAKPKANAEDIAERDKLREIMWKQVGILRHARELKSAIDTLAEVRASRKDQRSDFELQHLQCVAGLVARCALAREESRGSHYRADFPYRDDDAFQKHSVVAKGKEVSFC
jgi:L-aspartate oxidase